MEVLHHLQPIDYGRIEWFGRDGVERRRIEKGEVSTAHDETHLENVAYLGEMIGDVYGYNAREKWLVFTAGWLHDLIRHPSEDPDIEDDEASANEAARILEEAEGRYGLTISKEEKEAIAFAIASHGRYPAWLEDPETREREPERLEEKLHFALFVADKIEANGVRVIARRSSFVAGDRLKEEDGDWRDFGFEPNKDEALVVAIESVLRLTFINPEEVYPDKLRFLIHPLYQVQREFVHGIFKTQDLKVEGVAQLLIDRGILAARRIDTPQAVDELSALIESRGGITNTDIEATSGDLATSASETVEYFSSRYKEGLDRLIAEWMPTCEAARRWKVEMEEYAEGTWSKTKQEEMQLRRKLQEFTPHDESLMPMIMGSPWRVPDYAYDNWDLQTLDEKDVVDLYRAEWAIGSPKQLALVSDASERAGFGDYPELLRQKTGKVVAAIIARNIFNGEIHLLDVGSGPGESVRAIWESLPEDVRDRIEFILLDPSTASNKTARQLLESLGVRHQVIDGTDLDIPDIINSASIDILTGVASIHHHSHIPFEIYYQALRPGGLAIFADWHNSLWEHPSRVYQFLQQFVDWPEREEGLKHWLEVYRQAREAIPDPINTADRKANQDITDFWNGYNEIVKENSHLGPNAIFPHEGHRPVERYVEGMQQAGFLIGTKITRDLIEQGVIKDNPHQILPDSRLLMVTVGQKI